MSILLLKTMGWIGGILLAVCALPETIKAIKNRKCTLAWATVLLWVIGETFVLIPICFLAPEPWLIANYGTNVVLTSILLYYKIIGRNK